MCALLLAGCTPLDCARIFGPHSEIEGTLGTVMLDRHFNRKRLEVRKKTEVEPSNGRPSKFETSQGLSPSSADLGLQLRPDRGVAEVKSETPKRSNALARRVSQEGEGVAEAKGETSWREEEMAHDQQNRRRRGIEMHRQSAAIDARFDSVDERLTLMDTRFDSMDERLGRIEGLLLRALGDGGATIPIPSRSMSDRDTPQKTASQNPHRRQEKVDV